MGHTIGNHSDDRGGEADLPCYCDTEATGQVMSPQAILRTPDPAKASPKKQFTDKLDELLTEFYKKTLRVDGNTPDARAEARQQILIAIDNVIGKYETRSFRKKPIDAYVRDQFRAELRQALGISPEGKK